MGPSGPFLYVAEKVGKSTTLVIAPGSKIRGYAIANMYSKLYIISRLSDASCVIRVRKGSQ